MSVFHVAAEPIDLVQKCLRCGRVIVDYVGAMTMEGQAAPMFFAPYRLVEQDGNSWTGTPNVPTAVVDANLCRQAPMPRPLAGTAGAALMVLVLLLGWCPAFAQTEAVTIVPCADDRPGPCWLTHGVTTKLEDLYAPADLIAMTVAPGGAAQEPPTVPTDHYELGMFRSTDAQTPTATPFSTTVITPAMISCGHRRSDDPVDGIPNPSEFAWFDPADVTKECRVAAPTAVLSLPLGVGYRPGLRAVATDGTRSAWTFALTTFRRAPRGLPCAGGTGVELSVSVDINGKPVIATLCLQSQ